MIPEMEHVSDTALFVAAWRAAESERPDALIHDPFAARLAGERGVSIAEALKGSELASFGIALRVRLIDELLLETIRSNDIGTVLNLGAGLDTRPWRMDLPEKLRWIEVDFPGMLDYKSQALSDVQPRCRLERIAADLSDAAQRSKVLH